MSYAKQDKVCERLHYESIRALEDLGSQRFRRLIIQMNKGKRELKLAIMKAYREASPRGSWSVSKFRGTGAYMRLAGEFNATLARLHHATHAEMKDSFNALYRQSVLRHAWVLDQVTPESYRVALPHTYVLHESAVQTFYLRSQASQQWAERWGMWVDAYRDSLLHNLALGSLNGSNLEEAMAEVDATKAGTPASTLDAALNRIYEFEGTYAISEGAQLVADLNEDVMDEEIWKTRGDLRVCDDCDSNQGLTQEDADGDIPLHPNCHCYWLLVPKAYADLLRSGSDDDRELADTLLARGLAPNALVIRNADGDIAGKAIVDFGDWASSLGNVVSSL